MVYRNFTLPQEHRPGELPGYRPEHDGSSAPLEKWTRLQNSAISAPSSSGALKWISQAELEVSLNEKLLKQGKAKAKSHMAVANYRQA